MNTISETPPTGEHDAPAKPTHPKWERTVAALGAKPDGDAWRADTCPACGANSGAITVREVDGSIRPRCAAHCKTEAIAAAIGMTTADWWRPDRAAPPTPPAKAAAIARELAKPEPTHPRSAKRTATAVSHSRPVLVCMRDVQARETKWLWPGRIPRGRLTLLVGRPGEGKSFLTCDWAARVTNGTPWPDGSPCEKGSVILISVEDDPHETIKPRLESHGADCSRVHLLAAVQRINQDGQPVQAVFSLDDVTTLETAFRLHSPAAAFVDPVGNAMSGRINANRENEVRSILAPVAKLAEQYGTAVVVVAHRRKSAGGFADDSALGSRAFTGIARAVWHVSRDPANKCRRLLLPGKNNLAAEGAGLAFTIGGDPPAVVWEKAPVALTADDAMALEAGQRERARPGPEPELRSRAVEWLRALLTPGPMESARIRDEGREAGYSPRTLHRAKDELGIQPYRKVFGGAWWWRLLETPADLSCQPPQQENNLASWQHSENTGENCKTEPGTVAIVPSASTWHGSERTAGTDDGPVNESLADAMGAPDRGWGLDG